MVRFNIKQEDNMKKIDDEILAVLSNVEIEGNILRLTCGQLDRKMYVATNKILETMGGKWSRKDKGHIFPEDPTIKFEDLMLTGEIEEPKKYGYFPTPPKLVARLIELAELKSEYKVLEPSAGQGAIASMVADVIGQDNIDCIELLAENVAELENQGFGRTLISGDFMEVEVKPLYDRVVMNPPFERQQDIDHVLHAWNSLKNGGRLVAIMSSGITFRENRKTVGFRETLEEYGYYEHNPEGSFKPSGTQVNTVIVVMDKPA